MHDTEDLGRALGRLEGKMDMVLDRLGTLEDHDHRIGSLERWRAWLTGSLAVITGMLGILFHRGGV